MLWYEQSAKQVDLSFLFCLHFAIQDLLSEVSRCTRLLKEMKQKGPLEQDLIAKVKALNEEVISFKSRAL